LLQGGAFTSASAGSTKHSFVQVKPNDLLPVNSNTESKTRSYLLSKYDRSTADDYKSLDNDSEMRNRMYPDLTNL
jgi:hypothetical protein